MCLDLRFGFKCRSTMRILWCDDTPEFGRGKPPVRHTREYHAAQRAKKRSKYQHDQSGTEVDAVSL